MMKSCLLWLTVFADLLRFLVLSLRSESALAAENLFLRKQLAFYKEQGTRNQAPPDLLSSTLDPPMAQPLVQLAQRTDGGDAQNLHWLAPQGLPAFMA
jgi:hypothetical protein